MNTSAMTIAWQIYRNEHGSRPFSRRAFGHALRNAHTFVRSTRTTHFVSLDLSRGVHIA